MLQYVLESSAHVDELAETIVATSTDPSDDPIAEFCDQVGAVCFRGSRKRRRAILAGVAVAGLC